MTLTMERPATVTPPEPATPPARTAHDKAVFVAYSGDLEPAWATFIMANAAAASGLETTIFFTFWGLRLIVKPDAGVTGSNWMQKMLSVMNPGGTRKLGLSRMNFMGAGPAMMRSLAKRYNVASPQELLESARDLGVKLVPCQMSMDMFGLKPEDLIDGLEEPAGAAAMLEQAREAATFFV